MKYYKPARSHALRIAPFAFLGLIYSLAAGTAAMSDEKYAACTAKNNYLEASLSPGSVLDFSLTCQPTELSATAPEKFSELEAFGRITQLPPECILAAQKRTPEVAYRWGVCNSTKKAMVTKDIKKPCLSEKYHFLVYVSYLEAMTCLGIDPREMFGLFSLESNFQINIGSHTGAWGIGQLTSVAVHITNKMKRLDAYGDKPECASVKKVLASRFDPKNSCGWVEVPNNPTLNFLYSGSGYLAFKGLATAAISKAKMFSKMSAADKERSILDLTRYLYNGGDGGVLPAFWAFAGEMGNKPITFTAFRTQFRDYLKLHYGESVSYYKDKPEALVAKRDEVSKYAGGVDFVQKAVEKEAGLKCGL